VLRTYFSLIIMTNHSKSVGMNHPYLFDCVVNDITDFYRW